MMSTTCNTNDTATNKNNYRTNKIQLYAPKVILLVYSVFSTTIENAAVTSCLKQLLISAGNLAMTQ